MTDPIADMLNRIRNAQAVLKEMVIIPFSNVKYEIAKILEKEKFIEKVEKKGRKIKKTIEITLKYNNKEPLIMGLKRISKPGQRIYIGYSDIKKIRQGYGISIISTPKGLMTGTKAKKEKAGGEVIAHVW